jgi:Tol biopolymer transport system component/DNA-binding winged helix-turn-helix (wHTH) protein
MTSIYPQRVRFGPFQADLETHELWKNGIKVKLGGQPFEILAVLLDRPGQLVTREELQKQIWAADTFVDFNHGLNAAVNKLRETLSDSAEAPKYIETLPRRGYRFIGTIDNALTAVDTGVAIAKSSEAVGPSPLLLPAEILDRSVGSQEFPETSLAMAKIGSFRHSRIIKVSAALVIALGAFLGWRILGSFHEGMEEKENAEKAGEASALSGMLTLVPDPAGDPAISPDGKLVAFRRNSYEPGTAGIYVTGSNGHILTQLTQHPGDCCPAWSPDGNTIAFTRIAADDYGIFLVNATGGTPRKISHEDPRKKRGELGWTADGKFIAFSGDSPQGGSQIFLLSISDSSVRALTTPQGQDRDWGPSFSPDGTRMAFVRANGAGFPEEIFVMELNGGPAQQVAYKRANNIGKTEAIFVTTTTGTAQQITNQRAAVMGPPAWSADGQSILFSSTKAGEPSLWRIPASGGNAVPIKETGTATWHPTVSRGGKLVVQKILRSSGIYRVDLEEGGTQQSRIIVTSTNGRNEGPSLSPDGARLLFMSDRSGTVEIWASNRDGSAPVQLTNLHGCGTPRLSPDGLWVAFDTNGEGAQGVYVVSAMGGAPRALVADKWENSVPSWSRDGKWVYFGSHRSGEDQVWKVPLGGGAPVQVTEHGGFAAWESSDGKTLYYAKTRYENPEIWQIPVDGGIEARVSAAVRPKSWAAWSLTSRGIFFSPHENAGEHPSIDFYDFKSRMTRQVSLIDRSPFWLSVSQDGKEMFYDQAGQDESSILLVKSYK